MSNLNLADFSIFFYYLKFYADNSYKNMAFLNKVLIQLANIIFYSTIFIYLFPILDKFRLLLTMLCFH